MTYRLEKYNGRSSRHECPNCHDKHSFAFYVDESGNMLDRTVGRCNHESACGYHYTPKQFFTDNPERKSHASTPILNTKKNRCLKQASEIPFKYLKQAASYNSTFIEFLCRIFDRYTLESPTIERLMEDYALGATKDRSVIYWQIDAKGRIRTGKIMKYNPETGHRVKDAGGINWVHAMMKKQKLLPDDYNLVQCLFGEHLLTMYPDRVVALVESEKSALIGAGVFPNYIWLATGGKSQLSIEKLKVLAGRTVIMFPDVDGFEYWKDKAKELNAIGCNAIVSDLLEKNSSDMDRKNRIDIADWLIAQLLEGGEERHTSTQPNCNKEYKTIIQYFMGLNPLICRLINEFGLVTA